MKNIQINLFCGQPQHSPTPLGDIRFPIAYGNIDQLSNANSACLDKILLKIFCYRCNEESWKKKMAGSVIPFQIYPMPSPGEPIGYTGYDYKERTRICLESESKYSIRIDDDQFISTPLWNFMLNTIEEVLSQERIHAYCPVYNTGMPSVDYFVEDFLSKEDNEIMGAIFKQESVPAKPWHPWCDYTHLQQAIAKMEKWDSKLYWKEVLTHNTVFQSIHPIRFSAKANAFLTKHIFANFNKILEEQEYECMAIAGMPNSHWTCTRTANWRRAVADFGHADPFDEMSMQENERRHGLSTVYIKRGFAIHPCHGLVPDREKIDGEYAAFISKIGTK